MRVLLIAPVVRSGVFTHVCDLADSLVRCGVTPYLAVVQQEKDSEAHCRRHISGSYVFVRSADDLFAYAQKEQAALLHAHSPHTLQMATSTAKKMSVPLIITLHGIIDWPASHAEALTYASQIIATGPETARSAGAAYEKRLTVIYNGIQLGRFRPPASPVTGSGVLRILYYGRTSGSDARGLIALDQAVELLRRRGNRVEARMVGRAAGVFAGNFQHLGWLDDPLPALHWSDVVFGRGRSLREAMACGRVGFLLGEGYGGALTIERMENDRPSFSSSLRAGANPAEAKLIADDLLKLQRDDRLLPSLQKQAYEIADRWFDAQKMAEETANLYRRATKRIV